MKRILLAILLCGCSVPTEPIQPSVWISYFDTLTIYPNKASYDGVCSSSFEMGDSEYSITFDRIGALYGAQIESLVLRNDDDSLCGTYTLISSLGTEIIDYNRTFYPLKN